MNMKSGFQIHLCTSEMCKEVNTKTGIWGSHDGEQDDDALYSLIETGQRFNRYVLPPLSPWWKKQ